MLFLKKNHMHKNIIFLVLLISCFSLFTLAQDNNLNQLNDQGQKTGLWKVYYDNGKLQYESNFENGYPVGKMKRYYPGGILKAEMNFSDEGKIAYAKLYYKTGKPAAEGKYINNVRDSTWIFYSFINGRVALKEDYSQGEKDGLSFRYYDDGKIAEKMMWENGKKNGTWEQFYENGNLRLKGNHRNDLREGSFETYSYNGFPSIKGQYKNGVMDGTWKYFQDEGAISAKVKSDNYESNQKKSPGELDFEVEYINGKMLPNEEVEKQIDDFSRKVEEAIEKYSDEEEKL
jgi:antitoxin component YwqK of YwqJK toxin-antitoxin module